MSGPADEKLPRANLSDAHRVTTDSTGAGTAGPNTLRSTCVASRTSSSLLLRSVSNAASPAMRATRHGRPVVLDTLNHWKKRPRCDEYSFWLRLERLMGSRRTPNMSLSLSQNAVL